MFTLFPEQADDLLDVAALPSTEKTELNYRTRPLSLGQERRLTFLILFGILPVMLTLSSVTHRFCSVLPIFCDAYISACITYGGWLLIRRLTGALQRRDALIGYGLLAGGLGGVAWELISQLRAWSLEIAIVVTWITCCLMAKQCAAWILVGPTVDHETMKRWRFNLPEFLQRGFSLDCPELITFAVSLALIGISWAVSLLILAWASAGILLWPFAYAVAVHLVWLAWHALAFMFVPWPNPDETWQATLRAVRVFATYDIHNLPAAGIFRFPTKWLRLSWNRWALLAVTLVVIGFGFGVHCPNPATAAQHGSSFTVQMATNAIFICLAGPIVLCCTFWLVAGTTLARFEKELSHHRDPDATDWDNYVDRLINSNDELEREHILMGTTEKADYPVLIHRKIHDQHGHILGDSGSSKTALAMAPQATQMIARADSTVVIVDLKGDKALFESCRREAARTGKMRFRWISNEVGKSTFSFNPFLQSHNAMLSVEQMTQELLQGLSLDYGIKYGAGYFTAMNEIVLNNVLKETGARSFTELSSHLSDRKWYSEIGYEEDWKQARHLSALVKRLGGSQPLNVVPEMPQYGSDVHENAIDMANLYQEPQVIYLWLRSAVEPTNAPAIARMFLWAMFTAASHQPQDQNRVYFFIDEMQQIISDGIKLIFEQFRDMGGTIIGAHQTAGQLRRDGTDLGDTIDSCTAVKQVFRASDLMSLERLEALSGSVKDHAATWHQTYERGTGDMSNRYEEMLAKEGMVRVTEQERARYDGDELRAISSRLQSSLVRFTFGSGYTQFAGRSIPVRSSYHIPYDEYLRLRAKPWPTAPGAFIIEPPEHKSAKSAKPDATPPIVGPEYAGDFDNTSLENM